MSVPSYGILGICGGVSGGGFVGSVVTWVFWIECLLMVEGCGSPRAVEHSEAES